MLQEAIRRTLTWNDSRGVPVSCLLYHFFSIGDSGHLLFASKAKRVEKSSLSKAFKREMNRDYGGGISEGFTTCYPEFGVSTVAAETDPPRNRERTAEILPAPDKKRPFSDLLLGKMSMASLMTGLALGQMKPPEAKVTPLCWCTQACRGTPASF